MFAIVIAMNGRSHGNLQTTPASQAAVDARTSWRDHPFLRSKLGIVGTITLTLIFAACLSILPFALDEQQGVPRYNAGDVSAGLLAPSWWPQDQRQIERARSAIPTVKLEALRASGASDAELRAATPKFFLGSDGLGRSMLIRVLAGGGISLAVGIAAATLSVFIGTVYGSLAGYLGGRIDAMMMRVVDVLYGLPYVLLVVLVAVASDSIVDEYVNRSRERTAWVIEQARAEAITANVTLDSRASVLAWLERKPDLKADLQSRALEAVPPKVMSALRRTMLDVATLLFAIGAVSWLTMARVIRGQVLSLKRQPFIESARAIGVPPARIFARHLLPNLTGPIVVYATLTVPQAILQESFLSFLGIGVKPPLPSWGNLAAEGLGGINPFEPAASSWWLLFFPCVMLGVTLLALNFVGEGLSVALDPKRSRRS